jgi:hypothetical protein
LPGWMPGEPLSVARQNRTRSWNLPSFIWSSRRCTRSKMATVGLDAWSILLFLLARKLLHGLNFYMSGYLEARREEYVERMRAVSRDGAWTEWCEFFLKCLIEQVSSNQAKAHAILNLHQRMSRQLPGLLRFQFAGNVVDFIFAYPMFASALFTGRSGVPQPSALRFVALLRDGGILTALRERSGRRPAIYAFSELLNIAEGRPSFDSR